MYSSSLGSCSWGPFGRASVVCFWLVAASGLGASVLSIGFLFVLIPVGHISSVCVAPYGIALFSIGELLVIGVEFSCCFFMTALSILGVEILEIKVVRMSRLLGEVATKSYLLSDVYTLSGLFCVESDVRVITSIVGGLIISSSLMRMKGLF